MTKKEHAKQKLRSFLEGDLRVECLNEEEEEYLRELVHAIDEAERDERGVVDVQEITGCFNCPSREYDAFCDLSKCTHYGNRLIEDNCELPPWCPRRKENRKA